MNREIKFRAWDIGKKVFIPTDVWAVVTTNFAAFGMMLEDWEDYRGGEFFYKDTQVLMQYIGLKDRNGVEIYEGDILSKVHINELGKKIQHFYVVIWSSSDVGFVCKKYVLDENEDGEYWRRKNELFDSIIMVKTYNHVIGNIYENPELLK